MQHDNKIYGNPYWCCCVWHLARNATIILSPWYPFLPLFFYIFSFGKRVHFSIIITVDLIWLMKIIKYSFAACNNDNNMRRKMCRATESIIISNHPKLFLNSFIKLAARHQTKLVRRWKNTNNLSLDCRKFCKSTNEKLFLNPMHSVKPNLN